MSIRIKHNIATKEQWELKNPILFKGELGIEQNIVGGSLESTRIKVGDGVKPWNQLDYTNQDEYPYSAVTTVDIGGIPKGTNLQGLKISDIIEDLTSPYINPEFTSFTANDKTSFTYEIGTVLPSTFNLEWNLSNLINVSNNTTGIIDSNDNLVFSNLGNVNLKDLVYTLNTNTGFTYNIPSTFNISVQGINTIGGNIASITVDFSFLSRIRWGVKSQDSITTTNDINSLDNTLLTDTAKRTYNFPSGYVFILIPEYINTTNIRFIDADNNLGFSMALQSEFDSSLPSTVSYNNGNTTFDYKIFRGEFFYNSNINIRIE